MTKYAGFDPTAPSPQQVNGWYDSDEHAENQIPDLSARVELTQQQWDTRGPQAWVRNGQLLDGYMPPAPPPQPYDVPKLIVIDRLNQAGLLRAARTALKMGQPDTDLSDDELLLRDRWDAAIVLSSADAQVRAFLTAIGADPDKILAVP